MKQPNYIVILTDDQGYGDLSCMGNTDFRTPHMDRLAREGVRFTDWYANGPVCSPTRASLMTGRYPGNAGVRAVLAGHRTATGLLPGVPSLATALKKCGYTTCLSGKWHLGLAEGCRPPDHGFDEWFGFLAGCIDYYSHIFYWSLCKQENAIHDLWENGREIYRNGEYMTDMITARSLEFIRNSVRSEKPFFLFVGYNAPHYPMHAPKKYIDRFKGLPPDRRIMAAMLGAVDDGVGEIMDELERQDILDNTCVFFQSDNGPSREARNWMDGREDPYYGGSTGKLKGHKSSVFEGGIRVPAILRWPGMVPEGVVESGVGASMDIFPTFVKAAGGDLSEYELDGQDILPWAGKDEPAPERDIFWELTGQTAVRRGTWKLVLNGRLVEGVEPEDAIHLANLEEDMQEKNNLKDVHPEITEELKKAAESWIAGIEKRWEEEWLPASKGTVTYTEDRGQ